jgi:hypothetical protein
MEAMIEAANAEFRGQPFLWQGNKDTAGDRFGSNAQRLPNIPHGLNDYSNFDRLCFLSALNPTPDHYHFLESRGLSNEEVQRAIYCSAVYQSAMRTSIRDLRNLNPKTIIVPDRTGAQYLNRQLPRSRIEKLNTAISETITIRGRPKKHNSNRDRVAAHRRAKHLTELQNVLQSPRIRPYACRTVVVDKGGSAKACNENTIGTGNFVTAFDREAYGTLFASKYSDNALCYLHMDDLDSFVEFLELFHENNVCSRKDANWLISPAVFDPNHPNAIRDETKRGSSNIVTIRNLWLDFEKGCLNPQQVCDLFPLTKMVAFNTYSHTSESPRFRVVFPFQQSLTADEDVLLYDNIAAKIEDAGYWVNDEKKGLLPSGLDISKKTPASLFYLPCQAKNPADSFFHDYYHREDRELLDPQKWITNSVVAFPEKPKYRQLLQPTFIDQGKVEIAIKLWRQSKNFPGEGGRSFWMFAVDLRSAGMNLDQIKAKLIDEYPDARHPQQRKAQIPSIMKSLIGTRTFAKNSDVSEAKQISEADSKEAHFSSRSIEDELCSS